MSRSQPVGAVPRPLLSGWGTDCARLLTTRRVGRMLKLCQLPKGCVLAKSWSMSDTPISPPTLEALQLEPLPYQCALRDYLKTEESDLWNWFSSNRVRAENADQVRL